MPQIRTETAVDALPATVWDVLLDFDAYPEWNPLVVRAGGTPRRGERIRIRVKAPGRPALPMLARVSALDPERRLQWVGGLPGVFVGRHTFELYPDGDGTRVVHRERFTGVLTDLVVDESLAEGYRELNRALAARAEGLAADA